MLHVSVVHTLSLLWCVLLYELLLYPSYVVGYWDSFLFGAIIKNVAVDILEYIFCCKYLHISVGYVPGTWELNHTVYICLALGNIANFPVDQEGGKELAGWCWPRVSHVVGVRMSAGTTITWRLDWKALFQNGSLSLLLAVEAQFLTAGLLGYPHDMMTNLPPREWCKRVSSPFNFSHSNGCAVICYCGLVGISLITDEIKYLFLYWIILKYFLLS